MRPLLLKTFIVLALTSPGLALADPPTVVGRISVAQGQVGLATDGNQDAGQALLNWPVTSDSRIVTERGGLAEFRVGAAAVRVGADSELEVTQLDDDNFRLRLNYGSAAVRIADPEMLRGFELRTDQARVTLTQPGWLRVDAQRELSVVGVIAGRAEVEGGGSSTTLEPGRRAEVGVDDLHLGALRRDAFDNWPQLADTPALRYVSRSVTGYEELDRYGNWRVDPDYGPLWQPRELPPGWAPYRYGRWTFLQPWGWTWVDDAPWGYAPSHYGRWVLVGQRWCWAPGHVARPAWAPALVGWVGGPQWQVTFAARDGRHSGPGVGWFPLSPRDTYAPAYRVSPEHQRRLDWRHDGAGPRHVEPRHEHERAGLTVVSAEQFRARGTVPVTKAPQAVINASALKNMPLALTPPPAAIPPPRSEGARRLAPRLESPQPDRAAEWRAAAERRAEERRHTGAPGALPAPPSAAGVPLIGAPARIEERRFEQERRIEQERRFEQERRVEQERRAVQERRFEQERQERQERAQERRVAPATPPSSLSTEPRVPVPPASLAKPERVEAQPQEAWRGARRLEPARVAEPRPAPPAAAELRERQEAGQGRHLREAAVAPQPAAPAQPAPVAAQLRALPQVPAPVARPVLPAPPQVERPPTRAPSPEMSQRRAEHEQAAQERAKARQEKREDGQPR